MDHNEPEKTMHEEMMARSRVNARVCACVCVRACACVCECARVARAGWFGEGLERHSVGFQAENGEASNEGGEESGDDEGDEEDYVVTPRTNHF